MNENIREFIDYLNSSPSGYHAAANIVRMMEEAGYQKLPEHEDWDLVRGG